MERYFLQTVGTPVISEHGQLCGRIYDIIIDPETGSVAAFSLSMKNRKVLAPIDVITWGRQIIIGHSEDIIDANEIHKVAKILEKEIPVLRNKVYTKKGEYIGKVIDYSMDPQLFALTSIVTARDILGILQWDKRIINYKDIIEIRKDAIIVKNNVNVVMEKKLEMATPAA
jgi:uncharacterized protein YrrD